MRIIHWVEEHPQEAMGIVLILGAMAYLLGLFPGQAPDPYGRY